MDSLYPVEFLNTLQFSGIANHKLELKVGVPILLLRNFNQSIGLCNGTRLIVKRLG
jgi:ATP-dependent DNA helicase PIF1